VPNVTGQSVDDATEVLEDLGFDVEEGATVDSASPAGTVAGTDPGAGTTIARYSSITLLVSNGALVPAPETQAPAPSGSATPAPTAEPTVVPTATPTAVPTATPTVTPTAEVDQ